MTDQEKLLLKTAKSNYNKLKKNKELYTNSLNSLIETFTKCKLPSFGAFKFNSQTIPTL